MALAETGPCKILYHTIDRKATPARRSVNNRRSVEGRHVLRHVLTLAKNTVHRHSHVSWYVLKSVSCNLLGSNWTIHWNMSAFIGRAEGLGY